MDVNVEKRVKKRRLPSIKQQLLELLKKKQWGKVFGYLQRHPSLFDYSSQHQSKWPVIVCPIFFSRIKVILVSCFVFGQIATPLHREYLKAMTSSSPSPICRHRTNMRWANACISPDVTDIASKTRRYNNQRRSVASQWILPRLVHRPVWMSVSLRRLSQSLRRSIRMESTQICPFGHMMIVLIDNSSMVSHLLIQKHCVLERGKRGNPLASMRSGL